MSCMQALSPLQALWVSLNFPLDAQGYVSKLEEVAGTFAWAAPELLMGGRCSDKVDMYSFGVVLWELATCERPQRGQLRDVRCAAFPAPAVPARSQKEQA